MLSMNHYTYSPVYKIMTAAISIPIKPAALGPKEVLAPPVKGTEVYVGFGPDPVPVASTDTFPLATGAPETEG
jgi:hypothetical protein